MSVDTQKILLLIPLTIYVEIVDSTLKYKSEVIPVEDLLILLPNWYTYRVLVATYQEALTSYKVDTGKKLLLEFRLAA